MKIIFDYIFDELCYGAVELTNDRYVEMPLSALKTEIRLPPCDKKVEVVLSGERAVLKFADSGEVSAGKEKTRFEYWESYELFGDVRYKRLRGQVWLE